MLTASNPVVTFNTSFGSFQVELFADAAPNTVENFLKYVNAGSYSNTIFHRSVEQSNFAIIQGGGFKASDAPFPPAPTHIPSLTSPALELESSLTNSIGTIAMARTNTPNSGTSEFFFNVIDNSQGLAPGASGGYAVFGKVLGNGLSILQAINQQATLKDYFPSYQGSNGDPGNLLGPMPLVNFDADTAADIKLENLILVNSVVLVNGTFSGTVFNDINSDGTLNGTDTGKSGSTVFIDTNDDGQLSAGEVSTVTDVNGAYSFSVKAGNYIVRVAPQAGWTQTSPINATPAFGAQRFSVASNETVTGKNFALNIVLTSPDKPILPSAFDKGLLDNDGNTNLSSLQFIVSGVQVGATVTLRDGQNVIGTAVAQSTSVTITPTSLIDGSHSITATQTLFGQTSGSSLVRSIIVKTTPPVITSTPPANAGVGTPYSYSVTTTNDVISLSLLNPLPGMVVPTLSSPLTWTPVASQVGNQSTTLIARDLFGNSVEQVISIAVNGPPFFPPVPDQKVNQGTQLSFTPAVTDLDELTYTLGDGAPIGATIDTATGLFTWKPTAETAPGDYAVTINVVDPGGLGASQVVHIIVNAPPVVGEIGNQVVNENTTLSFQMPAFDQDALAFLLLGTVPAGATVDSNGLFTWQPTEAQGGVIYNFKVQITDTGGFTEERSFTVTVNKVDSPPTLGAIPSFNVIRGQAVNFTAVGADEDIPFAGIVYSLDEGAPEGASIDPDTGQFTWNVPGDYVLGAVSITVRVTDKTDNAYSASRTLQVVVGAAPVTPTPPFDGNDGGLGGGFVVVDDSVLQDLLANPGLAAFLVGQNGLSFGIPTIPTGPAVLQQLAKTAIDRVLAEDDGSDGRLPAGIIEFILGFDSGIPHDTEQFEKELAASGAGTGDGEEGKDEIQKAGGVEPLDNPGSNQEQPPPRNPIRRSGGGLLDEQSQNNLPVAPRVSAWPTGQSFKAQALKAQARQAQAHGKIIVRPPESRSTDVRDRQSSGSHDAEGMSRGKKGSLAAAAMIPLLIGQLEAKDKLTAARKKAAGNIPTNRVNRRPR